MKEVKEPGIKLFGKKIALPENSKIPLTGEYTGVFVNEDVTSDQDPSLMAAEPEDTCLVDKKVNRGEEEAEKDHLIEKHSETKPDDNSPPEMTQPSTNSNASPESDDNPKILSIDEDTATEKPPKTENVQRNATNSQQKTLKKPDKILPCPRCTSMDTKFCYYNNYNVNQPRHFCKSCQRYWTAGGAMRNMPVGAGRRKNKILAPINNRYITISEAFQPALVHGIHNPTFKDNDKVLSFGSDSPPVESLACNALDETCVVFCRGGEKADDCSSGSSAITANSVVEQGRNGIIHDPKMHNIHGFASQAPCIPGVAWPYPWNSAVPVPVPLPVPFYPSPYWTCSVPGAWNIPWLSPSSPTSNQKGQAGSDTNLGKHSREGELLKPSNLEFSVLIPKTLRIDDPDEAAKSSIWATLGIKNDSIGRGKLFKAFQAKGEEKNHTATTSPVLQANPAALSRSICFQERA